MRNPRLTCRRAMLVDLNVVDRSKLSQVILNPDAHLSSYFQREEEKVIEEKQRIEEKQHWRERKMIKRAFENPCLIKLDKDIVNQKKRMEKSRDEHEWQVPTSLPEINCETLHSFHERQGTHNPPAVVEPNTNRNASYF